MAWKGLHITKPARLKLANGQIVVAQDEGDVRIPLEDVAWVILDTQQTSLTGSLLAACMEAGIVIITCDGRHMPCGMALPFHQHFRQPGVAVAQIEQSVPQKKRLWQAMIRRKIENQAQILVDAGLGHPGELIGLVKLVRSGDPENVEARAARYYWSHLFEDFRRGDENDRRNKLLNYGYAVVRAAIARALVAHGLLPSLGVGHASVTNPFNLADDLQEAFRPFVDRLARGVFCASNDKNGNLTLEDRHVMAGALLESARIEEEKVTLLIATEKAAASLMRAITEKNVEALILPHPD